MGYALKNDTANLDYPLDFTENERRQLASDIMMVLQAWGLNASEKCMVLGLSDSGRSTLNRYATGHPVGSSYDLLWRIGNLLAIYSLLLSTDLNRPERVNSWVTKPNVYFDNKRPVDLMRSPVGISVVRRWLEATGAW